MSNLKTEYIVGVNTLDLFSYRQHEKALEVPMIKEGITWQDPEKFEFLLNSLSDMLTIQPRYRLENDTNVRHFITYDAFIQHKDNVPHLLVYQRTKQAGEQKLGQKYSVGIGGHVELADAYESGEGSHLNLSDMLRLASLREIQEELHPSVYAWAVATNAASLAVATIIDNSDAVGRVHIGVTNVYLVPQDVDLSLAALPDHIEIGLLPLCADLIDGYDFENWTKMLITALVDHPFVK